MADWADLSPAPRAARRAPRSVFISHASEDTEIAFNVAWMLKRYLDLDSQVDRGFMRSGADWRVEIALRMAHSELVIVLLSRVVAGELAEGVNQEIALARALNIPVVIGCVRGYRPELQHHHIDFGEDGRRTEGAWDVAKFLLTESHRFRVLGLDSFHPAASGITGMMGNPERITAEADRVLVLGHTMKEWLGDYGNAIRHGRASVRMYFPAREAIGLDLLYATHRSGDRIADQIERAKREALALEEELSDPDRFECFAVPVKPMFSATVIDPDSHDARLIVDHYSYQVGAGERPKLVVRGSSTPLFTYYWNVLQSLLVRAVPLASDLAG